MCEDRSPVDAPALPTGGALQAWRQGGYPRKVGEDWPDAFRACSTGVTGSDIGQGLELLQDVKHIAVTRRIGPGVAVTACFRSLKTAVGRADIDADEHGLRSLKYLVMQTDPDGREIDVVVDGPRPLYGPLMKLWTVPRSRICPVCHA